MSWSGGKDSALALRALRDDPSFEVIALLTTVTEGYERISMHGVRRELLRLQALGAGLELIEVRIPQDCPNEVYEARMQEALTSPSFGRAEHVAFGDLFLEDVRAYREERLGRVGMHGVFPLWGLDTATLAREFVADGFKAILCCVDPRALDASFAGRRFDEALLRDLPSGVDPCGENGEFHTFVYDGPIFGAPVACATGEVVVRGGFAFCDISADG